MYKTVRHGENSLQYTILPQTEEVLNNSGLKGKGRDYSPSIHVRRSRRRSTVKYVLLIVFGVIIALALAAVPLYVMNGALFSRKILPDHHDMVTPSLFAPTGREIVKSKKKEIKMLPEIVTTIVSLKTDISSTSTDDSTTNIGISSTTTGERATTPPWTMPAVRSWKSSTIFPTLKPIQMENTKEVQLPGIMSSKNLTSVHVTSVKSWEKDVIIRPTMTPEPITLRNVVKYSSQSYSPMEKVTTINTKTIDDVLITTTRITPTRPPITKDFTTSDRSKLRDLKDAILSIDDDEEFKESLEVDEVFSLPPVKPDSAVPGVDSDEVTVSKAGDSGWYGARWPFVDTLSHFQWTDYSPGDNLLLPLLVAALSSVALVLLLVLAVRRRKRTLAAAAKIEVSTDDNTKLLTAENAEDGEE